MWNLNKFQFNISLFSHDLVLLKIKHLPADSMKMRMTSIDLNENNFTFENFKKKLTLFHRLFPFNMNYDT